MKLFILVLINKKIVDPCSFIAPDLKVQSNHLAYMLAKINSEIFDFGN